MRKYLDYRDPLPGYGAKKCTASFADWPPIDEKPSNAGGMRCSQQALNLA